MPHSETDKSKYCLTASGEFVISQYNSAKPFSSFLPGIAGINGKPMWVLYVNRGQCVCSFGTRDKHHPIMEFHPANRAYDLVAKHGFRTFAKLLRGPSATLYEPFQDNYYDRQLERSQRMIIAPSRLRIEEVNYSLGLSFEVEYCTVPQDSYPGLIRTLTIRNLSSDRINLELLDGLPAIVPYGVDDFCLKNMRRTIEAFVEVVNIEAKVPLFKAKVVPSDSPHVKQIAGGNFYLGFEIVGEESRLVTPVVDPAKIFGHRTDLSYPERFLAVATEDLTLGQLLENRLPCAMGKSSFSLIPGEQCCYVSVTGYTSHLSELTRMVPRIANNAYIESRKATNRELIEELTQKSFTCSGEPYFDHYVRQNFLDNVMRGGLPITLSHDGDPATLYLYSRKHGDLERDYNDFRLMPTRYSQGNGNFRDINQNRRSDLLFNPDIGETNVEYFYNLIQLDGFNPLVLEETRLEAMDGNGLREVLRRFVGDDQVEEIASRLRDGFTPGMVLALVEERNVTLNGPPQELIAELFTHCRQVPVAVHGEGFWIDHWTYNLDLLENFEAVYPDRFRELLFSQRRFTFYDNSHCVQRRAEKYVLSEDGPAQLGAVLYDKEKGSVIDRPGYGQNLVRSQYGQGDVYRTSLVCKMLSLIVNKLASLDPEGVGVEMEAGKPGWYDALNGLPGMFGSSICETIEIKRHILYLLEKKGEYGSSYDNVLLNVELKEFMEAVYDLLTQPMTPFEFWKHAGLAKEKYREETRLGVSGGESTVTWDRVKQFLDKALNRLDVGIEKAKDEETGLLCTYFRYEVDDYDLIEVTDSGGTSAPKRSADGLPCIVPRKFKQIRLPLFLEGPVHYLRCLSDKSEAEAFAVKVRGSELFDTALKMYKVNASLADQPLQIGRARVFTPGWLENESIWLHMEYKYMLELLRRELFEEFYREFRDVCVPFLDPEVYGRSILENCSFLVSSAHPDRSVHGNGYVARLSGATAELIHMLMHMAAGPKPFRLGPDGVLELHLKPTLPGWMFTNETRTARLFRDDRWQDCTFAAGTFSFMFLGSVLVTYYNASMKNTYDGDGPKPVRWTVIDRDGNAETHETEFVSGEVASNVRKRRVDSLYIVLQ